MVPKTVFGFVLSLVLISVSLVGCSGTRTDAQIAGEIQTKINSDSNIPQNHITVEARNGVVTLSGNVDSDMERTTATNYASQANGVKTVINDLQLTVASAPPPSAPQAARQKITSDHSGLQKRRAAAIAPQAVATEAVASQTASQAPAPQSPAKTVTVTIPEGTSLSIRLVDSIDSNRSQAGDTFGATLESPLMADGQVVVPKGAEIEGKIEELKTAGHFAGKSEIVLVLTKLSFSGKSYEIQTDQYTQGGASRGKRTAETVGGGAAVGALIGGLASGGKGALIGAGLGAGAGTGVQAITKGQQVHLASESVLQFRLSNPITVEPSRVSRNANRTRVE
ncbi:MAG: hypothetical protein QOJ42_6352 [Acidobacteriaceae bacterium]|nr:hypothetical protein [Acidobacteriaceae bacterium]